MLINSLKKNYSYCYDFAKFFRKKRKIQFIFLILFALIAGFFDVLLIQSVAIFLEAILSPDLLYENNFILNLTDIFSIKETKGVATISIIVFIILVILSSFSRISLVYFNRTFSSALGTDLSTKLFDKILGKNYLFFLNNNSSQFISLCSTQMSQIVDVIYAVLYSISNYILIAFISFSLFISLKKETFIIIISISLTYLLITKITKKEINKNRDILYLKNQEQVKLISESLSSIRDLILDRSKKLYVDNYFSIDKPMRRALTDSYFYSETPKYILELSALLFISIIVLISVQSNSAVFVIERFGQLIFAFQRLFPAFQGIYYLSTLIRTYSKPFNKVVDLLKDKKDDQIYNCVEEKINFEKKINFQKVSFSYPNSSRLVIEDINLEISKGDKIGILGSTGSGKSTLLDILMGLIYPKEGKINLDGEVIFDSKKYKNECFKLHTLFSHVPQNIFLADTSVRNNIALGINEKNIDDAKIKEVSSISELDSVVKNLPNSFNTNVGEKGTRLSGGQCQRIGIARSLYKAKQILVLDEATSALDYLTEENVIKNILENYKDLTIIMVAHRLSTLKKCDYFLKLEKGKIIKSKNIKDIL